jgi:hypothetical protein
MSSPHRTWDGSALWLCGLTLFASIATACTRGGVVHPPDGGKGTAEYCQSGDAEEQNCMACSSKPGCGFCAAPNGSATICQPGIPGDDQPSTCAEKLVISSDDCPAPPPPVD